MCRSGPKDADTPKRNSSYVPEKPAQVGIEYACGELCTYTRTWYKGFQLKSNPNTLEPERLLHVCPAACVIAQQYSSTTFRLIAFPFSQGKIQNFFFTYFSRWF
jgi:hypothetical protein